MPRPPSRPPSASARRLFAVAPLLLSACSMAAFEGTRTVESTAPAAGVRTLVCTTHNGRVEVVGGAAADAVAIRARLCARGDSQQEADANVERLRVDVQRHGEELHVRGIAPEDLSWRASPGFAFVLEVPAALAARLESHNGDIVVRGLDGALAAVTHNGAVTADVGGDDVRIETHNGSVDVTLRGEGSVGGSIRTHNGAVDVAMGGRSAVVDASTHNGTVAAERATSVAGDRRSKTMTFGSSPAAGGGGGRLAVESHNGAVHVR